MSPLIQAFLQICLLRLAPQDLPGSAFLVRITALLMFATGCLMLWVRDGITLMPVISVLLDLALSFGLLRMALRMVGKANRLNQALSALFGSSVVLQLAIIPILLLMGEDPAASFVGQLAVLLFIFLVFWSLVIMGHILRHAFDQPFWIGFLISVGYWILINDLLAIIQPG